MKKIYLLAFAACALTLSVNAQLIEDDFEFYTLGNMADQNPTVWSNWSQDPAGSLGENILVVDDEAIGTQSGFIGPASGQDALFYFDGAANGLTSGDYTVVWWYYIPAGQEGYFNIQGTLPAVGTPLSGVWNTGDIYFNTDGMTSDTAGGDPVAFPFDTWFQVSVYFDLDAGPTYAMTANGNLHHTTPQPFQTDGVLGAIDFFSASGDTMSWIDDMLFQVGPLLAVDDVFAANNFSVYPNPVTDILNIRSANSVDAIAVYDVLGKLVLSTTPDAISPSIDMSALNSGVYLVRVTIGDASKTVKVIR
jgi:hypothetical protein